VISLLRARDRIAVPWKNGGGVTREVAISPAGAGFEDFDWRVSIAEVREPGPFSRFENIDRTLVILDGHLALEIAGRKMDLDPASAPFAFAGEEACFGRPIDGAVTDLNVMTRRGRASAQVTLAARETRCRSEKTSLLMVRNETKVRLRQSEIQLKPFDALLLEEPGDFSLDGPAFVIAIT